MSTSLSVRDKRSHLQSELVGQTKKHEMEETERKTEETKEAKEKTKLSQQFWPICHQLILIYCKTKAIKQK